MTSSQNPLCHNGISPSVCVFAYVCVSFRILWFFLYQICTHYKKSCLQFSFPSFYFLYPYLKILKCNILISSQIWYVISFPLISIFMIFFLTWGWILILIFYPWYYGTNYPNLLYPEYHIFIIIIFSHGCVFCMLWRLTSDVMRRRRMQFYLF